MRSSNETDRQIQEHLQDARRSVRAALDVLHSSEERGFHTRRTARSLQGLESQLGRVPSTTNPYANDPDLMSEDQLAELSRQRREERRAAKEAKAVGVANG